MVLSHCLVLLRKQLQLKLSAVHLDYNIRPSSQVEAAFVNTWAREVSLPLTLVQLNGTESLSRMAFEDYSRGARYEAYHLAMEAMEDRAVAVVTGHHEDDAAENVLSNLFMGRSLFHIPVMGPEAFIEGVRIWRPLFSLSKRAIYAFAREMDIPYLKNIDAPCGKRAVLHNKVVPTLEDAFGRRTLQNIARVGQAAKDWKKLIDQQLLAPLWQKVHCFPHGAIVPYGTFAHWPEAFWEEAFVGIFHAMGCSMLSKRSIAKLVSALHSQKSRWFPIHKQFDLFINSKEGQIVIMNSKLFPGPNEMGCWKVSSSNTRGVGGASSLVRLLNGCITMKYDSHNQKSIKSLDLPAEVAARLPSLDIIERFIFERNVSEPSVSPNFTVQLTAELSQAVRCPGCDVSSLLLKDGTACCKLLCSKVYLQHVATILFRVLFCSMFPTIPSLSLNV